MTPIAPRAVEVLTLSRKEAAHLRDEYVGSGHLLLGLLRQGQGLAVEILNNCGIDLATARIEVEKQLGDGHGKRPAMGIPFSPRVGRVIRLAREESKRLGHSCVSTEHLLLGLLRDSEGVAGQILEARGVDIETTRSKVYEKFTSDPATGLLKTAHRKRPLPIVILFSIFSLLNSVADCFELAKTVYKSRRRRTLLMSSIACFLIALAACFELVRN